MMATQDPELRAHRDWLGLLQPVGLVVSPPALVKAQAVPSQNVAALQQGLIAAIDGSPKSAWSDEGEASIRDLAGFFVKVLGWSTEDIAGVPGGPAMPDGLELVLPDYHETLRPSLVVVDTPGDGSPLMLVQVLARGTEMDAVPKPEPERASGDGWPASPEARLERLLRALKIPAGLLCNGDALRLVYAPSGESSGHLSFPVRALCEVSGRPILAALHMLLGEYRVFSAPDGRRLIDILSESRKYQAEVSNALSDQVLGALWELLRGFQASETDDGRCSFDQTAREEPEHIYGGLLTVLMRLIFVLYAEDQGLMPKGEVYANNYSVSGLYGRLRADAGRYPDTMDQRYGAYAWLLSLFRLIFDGGSHGGLRLPARHGQLFSPDAFPFLEGRPRGVGRVMHEKFEAPRVSDGCIHRVLEALLILRGERLSYRALDVEQVGSVYEAMMGYEVERAYQRSIAVRPKHIVISVDELLEVEGAKRKRWLKDRADSELTGASATALEVAASVEDVVAALGRRVSPRSLDAAGTPRLMAPGTLYLQPGEERRRTGSHYTPRELTEPIVRTTLAPILEDLGPRPTPGQVLDLKVCDPAMGSGAFLVEACRQLAEALVTAWDLHDTMPEIPADEEPLLHARRLVAQRCLYGVDKNPFAVNLAKLSLWLVTLARDQPFTFLNHALKHGDSLVGLGIAQVIAFHWNRKRARQADWIENQVAEEVHEALGFRAAIHDPDESAYNRKHEAWCKAEEALADARMLGDLAIAAFLGAPKTQARRLLRGRLWDRVELWREGSLPRENLEKVIRELREGPRPVSPLHWELEFPEVFERPNPGFDAIVGNPPFAGKNTTIQGNRPGFLDWLKVVHPQSHGNADLVAHFYRRAFDLLRKNGAFGLIATNTIGQGDTRATGLRWICTHDGRIYSATRRRKWPGMAAVVVSVVHVQKGAWEGPVLLDGRPVPAITAFLFHAGGHENPATLRANANLSFVGSYVLGMGFSFDDTDKKGVASPLSEMRRLIEDDPRNAERIFPYIGGQEINQSPTQAHHRHVINFGEMSEAEARRWPELMEIVEARVKGTRGSHSTATWWHFERLRPELYRAIAGLERVLAIARVGQQAAFTFLSAGMVCSEQLIVFPLPTFAAFCALQSRPHEIWARFFGSSMKDDLRYTPSDCFETFPFPEGWQTDPTLEAAGEAYYSFRAELMLRNDEGLTRTYNHFHDPNHHEPYILKLRELHAAMDRAVLDAYGWQDLPTDCAFLLDYAIDEATFGSKKKPWRYRWPEAVHDEVLARLLDLNQQRYQEELVAGLHDKKAQKMPRRRAQELLREQGLFDLEDHEGWV